MAMQGHGTRLLLVILIAKIAGAFHHNRHGDNLDSELDDWGFGFDEHNGANYGDYDDDETFLHDPNGHEELVSGVGDVTMDAPVEKHEFRHLEDLQHLLPVKKHKHGNAQVHENTKHVPIRKANAKHVHSQGGIAGGDDDWDLGLFDDDYDNGANDYSHGRGFDLGSGEDYQEHVDSPQDDFSLWHAFGGDNEPLGADDDDEIGNVHFNHGRNQLYPHDDEQGEVEDYDYGDFDIFDALPNESRETQLHDFDNVKGGKVEEVHNVVKPKHPVDKSDDVVADDAIVENPNENTLGGVVGLDDLNEDENDAEEIVPFEAEAEAGDDKGVLKVHDTAHHSKKGDAKGVSSDLLNSDDLFKALLKQGEKDKGEDLKEVQEEPNKEPKVEKLKDEDVPEQDLEKAAEDDENDSAFITGKGILDDSSFERNTRKRLTERLENLPEPAPEPLEENWNDMLMNLVREHGPKVVGNIGDVVANRLAGKLDGTKNLETPHAIGHQDVEEHHHDSIDGPVSAKWHKKKHEHARSKHRVESKTTHENISQIGNDGTNSNNADLSIALRYLGAGYDIIFGNPLGDPSIMVDPGYRNPVIKLNWNYEYLNDDGANLKEPKGSWVRPELSCRQAESVTQINTVDDYKKELSVDAQISTNIPFYFSFSGSTGYRNFVKTSSKKNSRTYILKTYCLRYVAGISDYRNMGTTKEFNDAVESLPTEFDITQCPIEKFAADEGNGSCREQVRPWMQFFKDFGTHFTTIIHLGGKVTNQFTVNKSDVENIQHSGLNMDSVLKANVGIPFATLGGGIASASETAAKSMADHLNSEKLVIVIGGDTQADVQDKKSMSDWTASLAHKPMPIKVRLESIRILIKDPKRQSVFDKALKYYSEAFGISQDEMYRVNGEATGVAALTREATPVMFNGLGSGSAVCPPKTSIIMGFSLVYRKRQGNFLNLKENEFDLYLYTCPVGEEKCSVSADAPEVETRIWILCGSNPIPLLTQHAIVENGQAATATCENGYSIAYGFGFSIPRGLDAQSFDTYACRSGQRTCYHTSQKKTTPNGVWIACVEDSAPELSKITNHVVSVSNKACTDKNKPHDFKNNFCPPNSKPITGWEMYLSETKKDQMKRFTSCPKYSHGCHIDPGLVNEHDKCRAFYSWVSCVAN